MSEESATEPSVTTTAEEHEPSTVADASGLPVTPAEIAAADRSGTWASWVAVLVVVVPTLAFRYPPMTDLPLHEALVGLMRHFSDPTYVPHGLYLWNLGHPNQLFHVSACLLSYIFGVTFACKVVVAAAQGGTILGARRLADYLGVTRWTSLLVVPLAIGWTYHWGLIANMIGFAVLLAGIPTIDRHARTPTAASTFRCSALFVLLYFAHGSVLVIGAGLLSLFVCGQPFRGSFPRAFLLRVFPVVFAGAGLYVQGIVQARLMDTDENGVNVVVFRPVLENIRYLPSVFSGTNEPLYLLLLTLLGAVALVALASERFRVRAPVDDRTFHGLVFRFRFELAITGLFLAYLFFPDGFAGGTFFNQRFLHPACAIAMVVAAPRLTRRRTSRLIQLLCGALVFSFAFTGLEEQINADRECRQLDSLIDLMEPSSAIAYVGADPNPMRRSWFPTAMAAHAMARKGGRMIFQLTTSIIAPVRMDPKYKWTNATQRTVDNTMNFMPQHDFHMFRYLLVRAENPAIRGITTIALARDARLVEASGNWALYESKLPRIGLLDPEIPLTSPTPETLRTRTLGLIQQNVRGFDAASHPPQ